MRRSVAALVLTTLLASVLIAVPAVPAVADGGVEDARLVPPAGQTAVKITDRIGFDGTVPDGAAVRATVRAVTAAGGTIESFDVTSRLEIDGTDVGGDFQLTCFHIPGCFENDEALRASVAGYTLTLETTTGSDTSARLDLDEQDPFLIGYSLSEPDGRSCQQCTRIVVRFNEDVEDPEGDDPREWQVDGDRNVIAVEGVGDERMLTLAVPVSGDSTPEVRYTPLPSPVAQLPNQVYLDRAGNDLLADRRFALAADRVPPPVPTIASIESRAVEYEDTDEAVPVLGNQPEATVVVEDVVAGTTVQLFVDDGDRRFESDQDTLVGEATATGDTVSIVTSDLGGDRVLRFYARALDQAECDPNDPATGACPNPSGRSQEALYDLETVPPTVGTVLARAGTISVPFSEPVLGTDGAGQWTVDNGAGPAITVTGVSGGGDRRTLEFSGGAVLPGATLTWTPPASGAYADDHGNQLAPFTAPIGAADLPLVDVVGEVVEEGTDDILPAGTTISWVVSVIGIGPGETVTMDVATADVAGGAVAGQDYTATSDTLTFTNTGTSTTTLEQTVTTDVAGDALDEFDEDVDLVVTDVTAARLPGNASTLATTGTIDDDDDQVDVGFASGSTDVGVDEADSITLTIELDAVSGKSVTVDWATQLSGDASAADVPAQSGRVTIPAGSQQTTIEVATNDDTIDEPNETFTVALTEPVNADLGTDVATLTIVDDDLPLPTLTVTADEVSEAYGPLGALLPPQLTYTFTLSQAPGRAIEVAWSTEDDGTAVAGRDYTAKSGTVRFEADETEQTETVTILEDNLDEFDETVAVVVVDPAGAVLDGGGETLTVLGTILDDDPPVDVALGDDERVTEGDSAVLDVNLVRASGKDVTIAFSTTDGTAEAGTDYRHREGRFTIPAGQTSATIVVDTIDDSVDELDKELTLSIEVVGDTANVTRSSATVTILDDDEPVDLPPGAVAVALSGGSVEEGDPAPVAIPGSAVELPYTISLSEPADEAVTLTYETRGGTADADDYTPVSGGSVTIPAGETTAEVVVEVTPDQLDEPDETVALAVTDATGAAVLPANGLLRNGTILDDDAAALLRVDDAVGFEGETAAVEVALDTASGFDVLVDYVFVDGSADASDHRGTPGTLRFPAGTTTRTIAVPLVADGLGEGLETLEVVLRDPRNAGVEDDRGTLTILDTDFPGTVGADGVATPEGDSGSHVVEVPVQLTAARDADTVVSYQTQDLTARAGEDYEDTAGQVTIPAGATSARIDVVVFGDEDVEPDEAFLVVLTDAGGAVITGPVGRVTIQNDDPFGLPGLPDLPDLPGVPGDDGDGEGGDGDGDGDGGTDGDGDGGGAGGPGVDDERLGAPAGLPATGGGTAVLGALAFALAGRLRRRDGEDA